MATIAVTILGKIGDYLAAPVGRQFGYLFHLNRNIETLIDEVEKLVNERVGIQRRVQAALNNVEDIEPAVEKWLTEAQKAVEEAQIFIQEKAELPKGCFHQWCLNLKPRFALSRNANKKTEVVIRLRRDCQFGNISCPAKLVPLLASTSTTRTFDTRKSILDEIIINLKDEKINMIGICGMGGVGKTTMAEQVLKRVIEEKLFDDCAMAVISQKQDFAKIQSDIAEMLGLKLDEQNPIAREVKLHQRLKNSRVLVILDDVWAEFDLKVLGITFNKGCKVIFTSREQDLWREVEAKIDFPLDVLKENEAWDLFEAKVGDTLKNKPELLPVAKEIVKECGGLPLALVTVGSALVGKSTHIWRDTLRQLKIGYPSKARGVSAKVYQSIELSYNFLDEEEIKSLFLLCCLFEEDSDIHVEDLIRMGLGLRLFRGVNGSEQARDRVFALLELLKGRYLLLPSKERFDVHRITFINSIEYIRMHDVVRDVAKCIAAEKGALILDNGTGETDWKDHDTFKNFTWISIISKEIRELPIELRSSQVKLLKCNNNQFLQITDDFFEGMRELQVLDLFYMNYQPLPSLIRFPSSLRTLCFRKCKLKNINFIGDLTNLESLSVEGSIIEEPYIGAGIISRLSQLQELYIGDNFIIWEGGENEQGRNANIREFESLTNLHTLHIWIHNVSILPTSPLFSNLKKYKIQIGDYSSKCFKSYEKCFSISLRTFVPPKGDIEFLSKNSEELHLAGKYTKNLVHELFRDGCQSLKCLELRDIDTLKHVANAVDPFLIFTLESLSLTRLGNLQQISRSPLMMGSFGKLKELDVNECTKLRNVFQLSVTIELVLLETLSVRDCKSMKVIIWGERDDNAFNKLAFPKLKTLEIVSLPRLISFCRGIDEIEFPQLKRLTLSELPQLVTIFPGTASRSISPRKVSIPTLEEIMLYNLVNMKEIWCGQYLQSGLFRNLMKIAVEGCNEIRNVLTPFMARDLVHLQDLIITGCSLLEVVVAKEEDGDDIENTIFLPALKYVFLWELPALESFCHVAYDLEFTMLNDVRIITCPEMKTFSPAPVSTPNLNHVILDYLGECPLWEENLNATIMHHHQQVKEKRRLEEEEKALDDDDNDDDGKDDDDNYCDDDDEDDNDDDDERLHLSNKELKIG